MDRKLTVRCNKCGKEHKTRIFERGQIHKNCGGVFRTVIGEEDQILFKGVITKNNKKIYEYYKRIVEVISTDEYSDMYDKIGAIKAAIGKIDVMGY